MEVGEAQRLKRLEEENQRLKYLVADLWIAVAIAMPRCRTGMRNWSNWYGRSRASGTGDGMLYWCGAG
jgi:hypothetical protein